MIAFEPVVSARPIAGALHYRSGEYAFFTDGRYGSFTSVLLNDVQIEIDADGLATAVWGMCPHTSWIARSLAPPIAISAVLKCTGADWVPGVSVRLTPNHRWPAYVDRAKGWLCLGEADGSGGEAYAFAPGSVAVLRRGSLVALWLRPRTLPG
jgi:hypothetical protein